MKFCIVIFAIVQYLTTRVLTGAIVNLHYSDVKRFLPGPTLSFVHVVKERGRVAHAQKLYFSHDLLHCIVVKMSKDKINIFPSRMSLALMKTRLKGAQKGHSLLKKKADALSLRFRQILGKIIQTKTLMGEVMKEAQFSLAEANFAAGDFSQTVLQNVEKAQLKLKIKRDNVAGGYGKVRGRGVTVE